MLTTNKKYIAVEVWEQKGRQWVQSRQAWWRRSKVEEIKVKYMTTTIQWNKIAKMHITEEDSEPE